MTLTEYLFQYITYFISLGGYTAVFVLTLLDSTVLPLPNETFMPFVGALIEAGRFSFWNIVVLSSIGAVLGSLTSYALGYYGAAPFVKKFGKYFRIKQEDLEKTHAFFAKYGERVILISRFIPVVRQFSSIPAGAAKMNVWKFCLYTAVGSTLWNILILGLGYFVGANSKTFAMYTSWIDKIIIVGFVIGIGFLFWKKRNKK